MAAKMTPTRDDEETPPAAQAPPGAVPPVPDDIPDPLVPPAVLEAARAAVVPGDVPALTPDLKVYEALLHGFCQHLQQRLDTGMLEQHKQAMRVLDSVTSAVKDWIEGKCLQSDHASYQLSGILEKLIAQGVQLRQDPYEARVQARSPQGFVVQMQVRKTSGDELVAALPLLLAWMQAQGYQALEDARGA